jgi:hypothetical protein
MRRQVQEKGCRFLAAGFGEGARVRHLPRGQRQDRAARLHALALLELLRTLV